MAVVTRRRGFGVVGSITTFRAMADAVTADGVLGSGDGVVINEVPAYVDVKVPTEVTVGDRLDIPATVVIPGVEVRCGSLPATGNTAGFDICEMGTDSVSLGAGAVTTLLEP